MKSFPEMKLINNNVTLSHSLSYVEFRLFITIIHLLILFSSTYCSYSNSCS